jgi:hypothetical protein
MGTSTPSAGTSGTGTPLIPSWLNDSDPDEQPPPVKPPFEDEPPLPPPGEPDRFKAPRTAFSRFARSGGSDRASLGRAMAGYVSRTAGGPRNAASRMGASRAAGTRLLGFLGDVATRGVTEALRSLNLSRLAGKPLMEIFNGLADYVCPEGGDDDKSIARSAFVETLTDMTDAGVTDLDNLTGGEVATIFELFVTHSIELRLFNDVGTRAISLPADIEAVNAIQAQVHDFIANGVADAVAAMGGILPDLASDQLPGFVDKVYENAFRFLVAMGEAEAGE